MSRSLLSAAGPTWSSTSSEGCVAATEQACAKLCRRLEPHLKKKDTGFATWQATIKEVQDGSMFGPSSVLLSAYGFYDGTERDADGRTTKGDSCVLLSLILLHKWSRCQILCPERYMAFRSCKGPVLGGQ